VYLASSISSSDLILDVFNALPASSIAYGIREKSLLFPQAMQKSAITLGSRGETFVQIMKAIVQIACTFSWAVSKKSVSNCSGWP
jgi:hypothetical protein